MLKTVQCRADAVTVVSSPREAEDFLSRIGADECVIGRFSSMHAREAKAFFLAAEEDTVGRPNKMMAYVMITEGRGIGLGKIGFEALQFHSPRIVSFLLRLSRLSFLSFFHPLPCDERSLADSLNSLDSLIFQSIPFSFT